MQAINLQQKFASFSDQWSPKIIAQMNDYHFKLAKVQGEYVWHSHAETDEVFIVLAGELTIELPDGPVALKTGEMAVVPRGVQHKPVAPVECHIMLVEPTGTLNVGDATDSAGIVATTGEWI